jgi:DNA-binding GntR family transcriptional regulator
MAEETSQVGKIHWEPLHEVTYQAIRAAIMTAQYKPGESLTVRKTAKTLGVSPMPVRAAFSRLVAERAVELQSNGTVVIPTMTRAHFNELVELRILLEGLATAKAASRITSKDLKKLEQLAIRLTEACESGNAERYLKYNRAFKFAIYEAARAPALEDLIERLWVQLGPFMYFYTRDIGIQAESDQQLLALKALRDGDADTARLAIESDIRAGGAFLGEFGDFDDSSG